MVAKQSIMKMLNGALEQEHACYIRYSTHATVINGLYAETIGNRLKEIAEDERKHAQMLRTQIDYMGGQPSMKVSEGDLKPAKDLDKILNVNIDEERKAIEMYRRILKEADEIQFTWLHETIEDIIEDEEEHLYELETLKGKQ